MARHRVKYLSGCSYCDGRGGACRCGTSINKCNDSACVYFAPRYKGTANGQDLPDPALVGPFSVRSQGVDVPVGNIASNGVFSPASLAEAWAALELIDDPDAIVVNKYGEEQPHPDALARARQREGA